MDSWIFVCDGFRDCAVKQQKRHGLTQKIRHIAGLHDQVKFDVRRAVKAAGLAGCQQGIQLFINMQIAAGPQFRRGELPGQLIAEDHPARAGLAQWASQ